MIKLSEEPLFLPSGSIRALIALGFTGATIYGWLTGADVSVVFPVTTLICGFYFRKRGEEDAEGN